MFEPILYSTEFYQNLTGIKEPMIRAAAIAQDAHQQVLAIAKTHVLDTVEFAYRRRFLELEKQITAGMTEAQAQAFSAYDLLASEYAHSLVELGVLTGMQMPK